MAKAPPLENARAPIGRPGIPSPRTPNCDDWADTAAGISASARTTRARRTYGVSKGKERW